MSFRVIVKPRAHLKIADVFEWYENKRNGLGEEFLDEWEDSVHYISNNPLTCEKKYKEFRHKLISRFPYIIIFELEAESIVIYNVIGAKENPKKRYKKSKI